MDELIYLKTSNLVISPSNLCSGNHQISSVNEAAPGYQTKNGKIESGIQPSFLESAASLNPETAALLENWEEDRRTRFDLPTLNASFYESVPVLEFMSWEITDIKRGYAETRLPLNNRSCNQYVTHQAALQLVAADYTGGIALASLFHLNPVLGFLESSDGQGIYLWGATAKIRWFAPSCEDLILRSSVPEKNWIKYIRRINNHQQIAPTLQIDMFNGSKQVAETRITYWAQDIKGLSRYSCDLDKINLFYLHKIKTTAKLVAGLRALETDKPQDQRLCCDPYAKALAGKQGITLALRFGQIAPEMQRMVAARTRHLDQTAKAFLRQYPNGNIVNIGAGYDTRFWRIEGTDQCKIYELDLPAMLAERKKMLRYDLRENVFCIPIDLRSRTISSALFSEPSFDHECPTLYIWEGGSMYFKPHDAELLFDSIIKLTADSPESRLWLDYVSMDLICGCIKSPIVDQFLSTMRKMGDPFVGGIQDIKIFARDHQMEVVENKNHTEYLGLGRSYDYQYSFAILKPNPNRQLRS